MSALLNAMKHTPDSYTENEAVTYSTTYNSNLDFFALASAKRDDPSGAVDLFSKAFIEDPELAVKNLFYLRDIRGGSGERSTFWYSMRYLINNYYDTYTRIERINHLVTLIPEYGRWKDVLELIGLDHNLDQYICHIVGEQLDQDISNRNQGKPVSLLSKWFPLNNCVKDLQRRRVAGYLCRELFGGNHVKCRKIISSLRKSMIVEEKISSKRYEDIVYSQVPSHAMKKYHNAFIRNDEERFNSFLEDVKAGKTKINAGTLYPHDIIHKILDKSEGLNLFCYSDKKSISKAEIDTLDALWNALPDYNDCHNSLCVVDISGSMYSGNPRPLEVSVSLGIYFAEHNTGKFHNHFITFSENPRLVEIKGKNIVEKVRSVLFDDNMGYNTNFESVFRFLLKAAKKHDLPQDEMPKRIYAISDMEFDTATSNERTNFEQIQELYKEAGYEMPTLVFWNVASRGRNVPVTKDENGVVLVSGFSPSIVGFITDGKTPEEFMLSVLRSKRYEAVVW